MRFSSENSMKSDRNSTTEKSDNYPACRNSFDDANLDAVHQLTKDKGKYNAKAYTGVEKELIGQLKQEDIKMTLLGGQGTGEIARKLFGDNPKAQKLYSDLTGSGA